jgi:hypothetical protein
MGEEAPVHGPELARPKRLKRKRYVAPEITTRDSRDESRNQEGTHLLKSEDVSNV